MTKSARDNMMDAVTLLVGACAVTLTVAVLRGHAAAQRRPGPGTASVSLPGWRTLIAAGHRLGPQNAKVTILEFGDFECPACGGAERTLRALREEYPSDVAVVFRHWPLSYHRFAYAGARAAECAGAQGRFLQYHDLEYDRQDSLGLLPFGELARRAGVPSLSAFQACNRTAGPVPAIEQDIVAAKSVGGNGTPTLAINGRRLIGVPDSAGFEQLVRHELDSLARRSVVTSGR
jgi:protein-disulfide isomerase